MATFGDTTQEASSDTNSGNNIGVIKAVLAEAGNITTISVYMGGGGVNAQVFRPVIYADNAGDAIGGAFKAVGPEISIASGAANAWVVAPLSSTIKLAAATYWIGVWLGATNSGLKWYRQVASGTFEFSGTSATYSSSANPPDPFPSGGSGTHLGNYSCYATYSRGGIVIPSRSYQQHLVGR